MKSCHLLPKTVDKLRPAMQHIQVKNGFVNSTNAFAVVRLPVSEVFGDVITIEEEIYFNATEWERAKCHKAFKFLRQGLFFTSLDNRDRKIGTIKGIDTKQMYDIGRYPDVEVVFPRSDKPLVALAAISFDPSIIEITCKALNAKDGQFIFQFYGPDKGIVISNTESKGIALAMPKMFK